MAEKVKKKPSFFTMKRWHSQKALTEQLSPGPVENMALTPQPQDGPSLFRSNGNEPSKTFNFEIKAKSRMSTGAIEELLQCSLCLEVLHNPKMLPCQHTFCMACLSVYIGDVPVFECPICNTKIQVQGPDFLNNLPSNLYIDSLLQVIGGVKENKRKASSTPSTPTVPASSVELFAGGIRCSQCQTVCDNMDTTACHHCKLNFCPLCWSQHLDDMRTQIGSILKQLESASGKLEYKVEHYKDRCERIVEQINIAADEKLNAIMEAKENLLKEAASLQKNGDMNALALKCSLTEAKNVAEKAMATNSQVNDKDQVKIFMNLHQNTIQLLSDISKWDAEHFVFDKENFRIEQDSSTPLDAESDDPWPEGARQNNPLESEDTLVLHYRARNFVPHYVWRKATRPGGVGLSPWNNHLYVCGMDSHSVLVVERSQAKVVARLSCEEMLCPVHIAFMKSNGEIYVTDKWRHCVHVFSKDNEYIRSIGQKGSRNGMFRSPEGIAADNAQLLLYVVDTGNDRVQVIQPDGKFVDQIGVATRQQATFSSTNWATTEVNCTEFNAPTSVAVTNERIVILDSGNRRVKVYNKQDKGKILEFGSLGQRKGQFRQPEVLAVDPMGFILVGDSGNCRVQVFKPNGQLVRAFGRLGSEPGKFGWISGIHITKQLDIIVSDSKNHSVNFF